MTIKTPNIASSTTVDDLIGNRSETTVRITARNLARQIAADPALTSMGSQNVTTRTSWSDLQAIAGTTDGQLGEVTEADTGQHNEASATGYDGDPVPNVGRYSWHDGWARWIRVTDGASNTKWAGRLNGWPDTFFRNVRPGRDYLGRGRWYGAAADNWSLVDNPEFDGKALRTTGNSALSGPLIWFDDVGVTTGDTITVSVYMSGSGEARLAAKQVNSGLGSVGAQINGTDDSNNITATLTAVPQRMSMSFVVSDSAAGLRLYPYVYNGTGELIITALWAGRDTAIPAHPGLVADVSDVLLRKTLDGAVASNAYAFRSIEKITSQSETNVLPVVGPNAGNRDLPFSGWAEIYTPAGLAFNAIRAKALARAAGVVETGKWSSIHVVVRTGTTPREAGASVVAVGSIAVDPEAAALSDVTILLRDPISNEIVTLDDTDFTGGLYLIGLYARTASGDPAALSEHFGSLSNTAGQSYYLTTADPLSGTWSNNASNARLGVDHLMLSDPVQLRTYAPSNQLAKDIAGDASPSAIPVWAPPSIYITEGIETSVYFDNLIAGEGTDFNWACNGYARGIHQDERWMFDLPASLIVNDSSASIAISTKTAPTPFATLPISFKAALASAGSGATPKVLYIGDSLTQSGVITQTLLDNAAVDPMGVTLIGTRGTAPNLHEGRGGYKIDDYATSGRAFYVFTVSGVTIVPAINSSEYTSNGATYRVQEVDISGGSGTITCSVVTGGAPASSGTLTRSTGAGDVSIAFDSVEATSGNPFWIGGGLDISQWLTDNSLVTPDWVFIQLGTNDYHGLKSDSGVTSLTLSEFAKLETLIAAIQAAGAGIRVALVPPPPPSGSQDAFAQSYGCTYQRWRVKRNNILWNAALVTQFGDREGEQIFICPAGLNWDTINNASRAASSPANSRSGVSISRLNNGVHPPASGYQQIGDAVWAFLKCQTI